MRLGELCTFNRGASVPRARMYEEGDYLYIHYGDLYKGFEIRIDVEAPQKPIPFILSTEQIKDTQWLLDQDIVYVLTSETVEDLGHSFLFNNPKSLLAVAGTETTIVRVKRRDLMIPAYLNYMMQTPRFKLLLRQYVKGMKVFRVHPDDLSRIDINLPCVSIQEKTVALLDSIYERQVALRKTNGYLTDMLDVLFDEVEARESCDWVVASLLDIADYKNGLAMQRFRPVGDDLGLPVLKIRELGQGYCGTDAERCRSDIDESVTIHDGNLVFSWSGTLLLDFWAGGDAGLNQHLFKVTSDVYPSWFYYMWTKRHMRRFISLAKDRATTMGHIKRSALQESEVFIPSADRMEELTAQIQPIVDEMIELKVQSRKLGELRDALLPKLMSGEIDASKIELPTQPNSHLSAGLAAPSLQL